MLFLEGRIDMCLIAISFPCHKIYIGLLWQLDILYNNFPRNMQNIECNTLYNTESGSCKKMLLCSIVNFFIMEEWEVNKNRML